MAATPPLDEVDPEAFIADKTYDAGPLINLLDARQITAVTPSRENRCILRKLSFPLYKKRNELERFSARLKQFRSIATHYDKLESTFLVAV